MDVRFLGPALADDHRKTLLAEVDAHRAARTRPASVGLRDRVARLLVAVALRLSPAVADAMPHRGSEADAPAWWEFDAPRGVFC